MKSENQLREVPLEEETIFRGKIFSIGQMQVQLPNGNTASREIVHHNGGACIVPIDPEGNIIMVRQHRISVNRLLLEIPAGKLDSPTEDPLSAAHRELEEETGCRATRMELLTTALPTPGYCTERLHIYLATGLSQHKAHPDPDEFLQVERLPLEHAVAKIMGGEITDAKTIIGILMTWEKLRGQSTPA